MAYLYKSPEELWAERELQNLYPRISSDEKLDAVQCEKANLEFAYYLETLEVPNTSRKNVKKAKTPKNTASTTTTADSTKALYRKHRKAEREEGRYHNNESRYKYFEKEIIYRQQEKESREIKVNGRYIVEREMETNLSLGNPFYEDNFLPRLRGKVELFRKKANASEIDAQTYEANVREMETNITKLNMMASEEAKILIPVEWKIQKEALQRRAERYKTRYKELLEQLASYERYLV